VFWLHLGALIVPTLCFHREVLDCFRRDELLDWASFQAKYGPSLREGVSDGPAPSVFGADEVGEKQWDDFRKRVIEHVSCLFHSLFRHTVQ